MRLGPRGRDGATLGAAASVAEPDGFALRRGEQAAAAAEVEDLAVAVQDYGDEVGGAGESSGVGGGEVVPGVQVGIQDPGSSEVVRRASRVRVIITVVASPPWSGNVSGSMCSSRVTNASASRRLPVPAARQTRSGPPARAQWSGSGRGDGVQECPEPYGDGVGQPPGEPGGAVPKRLEPQGGLLRRVFFLRSQPAGFGGIGDVGGDDLQDPASEATNLVRAELSGPVDQLLLRLVPGRLIDHRVVQTTPGRRTTARSPGHGSSTRTGRHPGGDLRIGPVQGCGEFQVGAGGFRVGLGVVGQPGRGITCTGPAATSSADASTRS